MKLSEIIAKLQELKATYGDVKIEMLSDEGNDVDINIYIEADGERNILSFYH
jgi:hypothetical protein